MEKRIEDIQSIQRNIDLLQGVVREMFINGILWDVLDMEITAEQMKCLRFICCNDKVLVGQLAKGLRISYPAATKAISRLEDKNIVQRQKDPLDKRNIFVTLTPKGVEIADKVKAEKIKRLEQIVRAMPLEDIDAFNKGMTALLKEVLANEQLSQYVCLHCGKDHKEDCLAVNENCFCYI